MNLKKNIIMKDQELYFRYDTMIESLYNYYVIA